MEFKYHVLALGGGIILGIIAAFVTKSLIVGIVLPVGIYVCAMLWGKVNSIQKEEGEITKEATSDNNIPPTE